MNATRTLLTVLIFSLLLFDVCAQNFKKYLVDTTNKALDISGFLNSPAGFMPVPLVITEPALGLRGGIAAVYFHNKANFIDNHCYW